MKKHYSLKICLAVLVGTFVLTTGAHAFFFLPPGPFTPTLDIAADAGGATKAGGDTVTSGIEKVQQTINKQIEKIKSFKEKVESKVDEVKGKIDDLKDQAQNWVGGKLSKITGALHKKDKGDSVIASSRKIEESKVCDISSEESIVEAFGQLFGTYPVEILEKYPNDQEGIKKKYEDKAVEFSNDAMIELHIAARSLDDRMDALEEEIKEMPNKYVVGDSTSTESSSEVSGEAGEANDDLGSWQNFYHVNAIYDSVVRITEELSALEAQYEAAQAMRGGVAPVDPREENKESSGDKKASNDGYGEFFLTDKTSFAQEEVDTRGITPRNLKIHNPAWDYIDTKPRVAKSPFNGAADQFQDMVDIKNLSLELNKAIDAHNLKQRFHTYKGPFVEYNRMLDMHTMAILALNEANQAVLEYLGRYYQDPVEVWFGKGCRLSGNEIYCNSGITASRDNLKYLAEGDTLCEDDKTKICSKFGINRYERLEGLSGKTVSAYKLAKAEKTIVLTEEKVNEDGSVDQVTKEEYEFVASINDSVDIKKPEKLDDDKTASTSTKSKSEMEELEKKGAGEQEAGANGRAMVRPSKEVELEENEREMEILPWQIGAEVSQEIGKNMKQGNEDQYGKFSNKFALWNDELFFYDQYLDYKYKNMAVYIRNMDLLPISINIATAIIGEIEGKIDPSKKILLDPCEEEDEDDCWVQDPRLYVKGILADELISYLSSGVSQVAKLLPKEPGTEEIYDLQAQLQSEIDAKRTDFYQQKESMEAQIEKLYITLDELNVALNDAKKAYNAKKEAYVQEKGKIGGEDTMVEVSKERKKKSENIKDDYARKAELNKAKYVKNAVSYAKELEKLEKDIVSKQKGIDAIEDKIDAAKDGIALLKNVYATEISKLQFKKEVRLKDEYSKIQNRESKKLSQFVRGSASMEGLIFSEIVSMADHAASAAKNNAINAIGKAYAEIMQLNDEKYYADKHDKIVNIHKKAMEKIKDPEIKLSVSLLSGYIPVEALNAAIKEALAEAMYGKICAGGKCLQPDEFYFVGLAPKAEDFAAPKAIGESYTPPVREIVHFDSVDFDAMNLNQEKLYALNDTMLNYGYEMPAIWNTLLSQGGFVDRDVDIIEHLKGYPAERKARSGYYPCNWGEYVVDDCDGIHLHKKGNYTQCRHIKDIKVTKLFSQYIVKVEFTGGGKYKTTQLFDPQSPSESLRCGKSELGYFVHYNPQSLDGLKFSNVLRDVVEYLDNLDDKYDKGEKFVADSKLYTKNQIGDYLNFVEYEQEYQKTLDQLRVKVEESRASIIDELAKFDYKPKKVDFNLAVEEDYKEVEKHIDAAKNKLVSKTCGVLKSMNSKNEVLQEQLTKLRGVCAALEQDKDELVSLTDNMTGGDELEQKIKTEKTDRAAQKEQDEEAEKAHKEKLNDFPAPYHSAY